MGPLRGSSRVRWANEIVRGAETRRGKNGTERRLGEIALECIGERTRLGAYWSLIARVFAFESTCPTRSATY